MRDERLYRGNIKCTKCLTEKSKWLKNGSGLVLNENGTYSAYCNDHRPEDYYKQLVVTETCIGAPWRMVERLTIHKLDCDAGDRRGAIITLTMKEMKNVELARTSSVEVCQMLMLAADERATIHCYGESGEQNNCWVEPDYRTASPMTCTIVDKYWGHDQTIKFRQLCRLMTKLHGWELEDETQSILDRIVDALEEGHDE